MDPKRKKIYIVVLALSVVLLVGVFIWSNSGSSEEPLVLTPAANQQSRPAPAVRPSEIKTDGSFAAPSVFPQAKDFDNTVIKDLKLMKGLTPVKLQEGDLGRSNPLEQY